MTTKVLLLVLTFTLFNKAFCSQSQAEAQNQVEVQMKTLSEISDVQLTSIHNSEKAIVMIYMPGCPHCMNEENYIRKFLMENRYRIPSNVNFYKVNGPRYPQVVNKYGVGSFPWLGYINNRNVEKTLDPGFADVKDFVYSWIAERQNIHTQSGTSYPFLAKNKSSKNLKNSIKEIKKGNKNHNSITRDLIHNTVVQSNKQIKSFAKIMSSDKSNLGKSNTKIKGLKSKKNSSQMLTLLAKNKKENLTKGHNKKTAMLKNLKAIPKNASQLAKNQNDNTITTSKDWDQSMKEDLFEGNKNFDKVLGYDGKNLSTQDQTQSIVRMANLMGIRDDPTSIDLGINFAKNKSEQLKKKNQTAKTPQNNDPVSSSTVKSQAKIDLSSAEIQEIENITNLSDEQMADKSANNDAESSHLALLAMTDDKLDNNLN